MRERKPRRKFLNLRQAITQAITVITHLCQLTMQTANPRWSDPHFPNFGRNHSTQMLTNSLQTFYLLEQLLLSQSSDRRASRAIPPLTAAIVRSRWLPPRSRPILPC